MRFFLAGRRRVQLEALCAEAARLGRQAEPLALDLEDPAALEALAASLPRRGPFIGAALVAGISQDASLAALSEAAWDRVWAVDFVGSARLLRAFAGPGTLAPGARAILVGSLVGLRGNAGQCAYAAAKGALLELLPLGPPGLRLNLLLPPLVPSPLLDALGPAAREALFARRLLPDPDPASSCAAAGAYLLSDASSYVHRQALHADSRVGALGWEP